MSNVTLTAEQYDALLAGRDAAVLERDEVVSQRNTLLEERANLRAELRVVTTERDLYHERLKLFQRRLFAAKSEARDPRQRDLFFDEAEALADGAEPERESDGKVAVGAHQRTRRGRRPLDPALPRVTVRHDLSEAERTCEHDGSTLVQIDVRVREQLDIVPEQIRVIRHEYPVYACPTCDQGMRTAPAPARIIPRSLFTEAALARFVVAKFVDGLPLYRVAAILRRIGGDISRGTLAATVIRLGVAVQPLINLMRDILLDSDIQYGDETTVQVLKEPGRAAQAKSFVWVQMNGTGPPVRLFGYSPTRGTAQAAELYAGVRPGAVLMTDGYAPYDEIARVNQLVHLGCWAHARRYFVEAEAVLPKEKRAGSLPGQFVALIGELFAIEARAKDATDAARYDLRQRDSRPVLVRIGVLLLDNVHAVLPQGKLGQALHYLQGQWPKLIRYVESGAWPMSNNACENAIRPFVVGRKAWLFADTVRGAKASMNLYSLIETCRANGVEPYAYLKTLFTALPHAQTADDYESLLPWQLSTLDV
ncbi:IS66 family transposase [Burkholderia latens]|uniref:IS66 family transposase n=2 Tax=Burkholderia TaxID=32008 RepID=UPI000ACB2BBC